MQEAPTLEVQTFVCKEVIVKSLIVVIRIQFFHRR